MSEVEQLFPGNSKFITEIRRIVVAIEGSVSNESLEEFFQALCSFTQQLMESGPASGARLDQCYYMMKTVVAAHAHTVPSLYGVLLAWPSLLLHACSSGSPAASSMVAQMFTYAPIQFWCHADTVTLLAAIYDSNPPLLSQLISMQQPLASPIDTMLYNKIIGAPVDISLPLFTPYLRLSSIHSLLSVINKQLGHAPLKRYIVIMGAIASMCANVDRQFPLSTLQSTLQMLQSRRPISLGPKACAPWAKALSCCMQALCRTDVNSMLQVLVPIVETSLLPLLLSSQSQKVSDSICSMIAICVNRTTTHTDAVGQLMVIFQKKLISAQNPGILAPVLTSVVTALGEECVTVGADLLKSIVVVLEKPECEAVDELEKVIGACVCFAGPAAVVYVIPLNLPPVVGTPDRAWLLPLIRDNCEETYLSWVGVGITPISAAIQEWALSQPDSSQAAALSQLCVEQLWEALPSLCVRPRDLAQTFAHVAKDLGMAVWHNDVLRHVTARALRALPQSLRQADMQEDQQVLVPFSASMLPCLLNGYLVSSGTTAQIILDAISEWARLAPSKIVNKLFQDVVAQMMSLDSQEEHKVHNLARAFIPALSREGCLRYWSLVKPHILTNSKRAYQALQALLYPESPFDATSSVMATLVRVGYSDGPHLKYRLDALACLGESMKLGDEMTTLLRTAIPEASLATHHTSSKIRTAALSCITRICTYFLELHGDSRRSQAADFVLGQVMAAGFGLVDVNALAGAVVGFGRALLVFRRVIRPELGTQIFEAAVKLLQTPSAPVLRALSGTLFPACIKAGITDGPRLLTILFSLPESSAKHIHREVYVITERLYKKYGDELIDQVKGEPQRVLRAIGKKQRHKQRKMERAREAELLDDYSSVHLQIDGNADDLLAGSAHVPPARPSASNEKLTSWEGFEVDALGRPILVEEGEEEDADLASSSDEDETLKPVKKIVTKRRREKKRKDRIATGERYKSKNGLGDIKREGAPDPFAYVKLDPRQLNRRRKANAAQVYEVAAGRRKKSYSKRRK